MASPPFAPKAGDPPEIIAEDSVTKAASSPHHKMSARSRFLIFFTAWLIVLMPFLFWWNTWFGRRLTDKQVTEFLNDEKHPRHIQHALVQLGEHMGRGALVSRTDPSFLASSRGSAQHRCLGHGPGHVGSWCSRGCSRNVERLFADV